MGVNIWLDEDKKLVDLSLEEFVRCKPLRDEEIERVPARNMPTAVHNALRELRRKHPDHFPTVPQATRYASYLGAVKMKMDPDVKRWAKAIDRRHEIFHDLDHDKCPRFATRQKQSKRNVSVFEQTLGICSDLVHALELPTSTVVILVLMRGLVSSTEWIRLEHKNIMEEELRQFSREMNLHLGFYEDMLQEEDDSGHMDTPSPTTK